MTDRDAFADALNRARRLAGLSQKRMARELGFSQSTCSLWETGDAVPSPDTVFALEQLLGLPPGGLSQHLGYLPADAPPPPPDFVAAIRADPDLSTERKTILIEFWEVLVRAHRRAANTDPAED